MSWGSRLLIQQPEASRPPRVALRKANLTHRARDDEDADVVGEGIRWDDEETVSVRPIAQCAADDDLVVYERDLDPAAVLWVRRLDALDVARVAGEIANEEHAFEPRKRHDHTFTRCRVQRRPERELLPRGAEVVSIALEDLPLAVADDDLLPRRSLTRWLYRGGVGLRSSDLGRRVRCLMARGCRRRCFGLEP